MQRTLRIVSWNIDGLARLLPGAATHTRGDQVMPQRLDALHGLLGEPDILLLQEVRIRPEDASVIACMEQMLPGYVCGHALCRDRVNVKFRGGRAYGVASYVRAALAPRWVRSPAWDREGRVLACELPNHGLMLGNVYAVNGTSKIYRDPDTGEPRGDRHTWKRTF